MGNIAEVRAHRGLWMQDQASRITSWVAGSCICTLLQAVRKAIAVALSRFKCRAAVVLQRHAEANKRGGAALQAYVHGPNPPHPDATARTTTLAAASTDTPEAEAT
jgi:hypothetical protein